MAQDVDPGVTVADRKRTANGSSAPRDATASRSWLPSQMAPAYECGLTVYGTEPAADGPTLGTVRWEATQRR